MRYLGIDYGSKRVGLATSDPAGSLATPFSIIERTAQTKLIRHLIDLIDAEQIEAIVVGLPLGLDGSDTPMTQQVHQFITALSAEVQVPVYTSDERLTSSMAQGLLNETKTKHPDAVAAQLLLQSFLDRKR